MLTHEEIGGNEYHNVIMSLVTHEEVIGKHQADNWVRNEMIITTHGMTDDEQVIVAVNLTEQLYKMNDVLGVVNHKLKWTMEQGIKPPGKMCLA